MSEKNPAAKSSSIKSLSSNYKSSPSPKSKTDEIMIKNATERLEKLKTQGKTIKDKDCANTEDPVSYNRIPKKYAIYIDKQCYDARVLYQSIQINKRIPLNNRMNITDDEIEKIMKKAGLLSPLLVKTLRGHMDDVSCVSWSPNGKMIASGSSDNTIKIWNASSGDLLKTLTIPNHEKYVWSVSWSPDSKNLVSASTYDTRDIHLLHIWDIKWNIISKTLIDYRYVDKTKRFNDDQYIFHNAVWSPDGTKIASNSWDTKIYIWDVQSRKPLHIMEETEIHPAEFGKIIWSPDSTKIASSTSWNTSTIHIWDVLTGKLVKKIIKQRLCNDMAWSPDSTKIVSSILSNEEDDNVEHAIIWDVNSGTELMALKDADDQIDDMCAVSWSPDGKMIIFTMIKYLLIWDINSNTTSKIKCHDDEITSVSWSPDSKKIVSGSVDNTIRIWNITLNQSGGKNIKRKPIVKK